MRIALCVTFSLLAVPALSSAQGDPTDAPKRPAWTLGNTTPEIGALFEAWFDPSALAGVDAARSLRISSPSALKVWLREPTQSCGGAEPTPRLETPNGRDLVFVCARPLDTGTFRIGATQGASVLSASDPIVVAEAEWFTPQVTAMISTLSAFLLGVAATWLNGWLQEQKDARETARKIERILVDVLLKEITANQDELIRVRDGAPDPKVLITAAYNEKEKIGDLAWGFLESVSAARYKEQLKDLYESRIPQYQTAVRSWDRAEPAAKAAALQHVRETATALLQKMSEYKR